MLRAFDSRKKAPLVADAPLPAVPAPPADLPAAIASSSDSTSSSSSSSSNSSSSSASGMGSATSASDFVPFEGVSDVGQSNVATRSGPPRKRVRTALTGKGARKKGQGKAKRTADGEWSDSD